MARTFYNNGSVHSETQHNRRAEYHYSRQNQITQYVDFFGKVENRSYNHLHQLSNIDCESYSVNLNYDAQGRVSREELRSKLSGGAVIRHDYCYSDEHEQRITQKDSHFSLGHQNWSVSQSFEYDRTGNLSRKIFRSGDHTTEESYESTLQISSCQRISGDLNRLLKLSVLSTSSALNMVCVSI